MMGVEDIQKKLFLISKDLFKKEPESISSIEKSEKGWKVQVEVLERKAVPDKFDLLKIIEFNLNEDGKVLGFKQIKKIQRGDTE
ncbi:MAG: gas vesicle protein GvpO [Nanoarchaeota archaeon]|nr:gas vesicle protein GvpO [Nanoarchaeota archaeon]